MPIIHLEDGLTPSKSKVVTMGGVFNDLVNAFATEIKTFTPPKGKQWEVIAMRLMKGSPAGGSFGEHSFSVRQGSATMMLGESVFNSNLDWVSSSWSIADSRQLPASDSAALLAMRSIRADVDNPLSIHYFNATDASNSKTGEITVHVLETPMI